MDILSYLAIWRRRRLIVVAALVAGVASAAIVCAFTRPQYVATTQLFVSATGGASVVEAYQGNLFGQERVVSYAKLASGRQVAERAIEQLQIDMPAYDLMSSIEALPVPNTVMLNVSVENPNPDVARDLANAVALQTSQLVQELETSARGGSPAAVATVVDAAETPTSQSVPNWTRNLLVGGVAGLLVGLIGAVARDALDHSVRSGSAAADAAGAPLVGSTPPPRKQDKKPTGIPFGPEHPVLSDAFRSIRTNVLGAGESSETGALVVAGPRAQAGATTVSLGLGAAVAELGRSVVVIDCDLHGRGASKRLDLDGAPGLGEILSGTARTDEVVTTPTPGLSFVPAGETTDGVHKLLAGDAMRETIKQLSSEYDLVLIDGAPILQHTDSVMFTRWTDGLLAVARSQRTSDKDIAAAAEKIRMAHANVFGVVVTDVG